ncbi:MAG: Asp-tRNA(Asn)/Glu-tRNA(Gln) amidotransferase subunit GatC [Clostridia bacterium]|nr:Asp-tRNA(Asn)/Glu-tRNA(Gln) amidotransferase subunit GatC [Clostridia bacterium]
MKTVTSEDIKHLASLSALDFDEEKIEEFKGEFESILGFVDQIANAKIEGVDTFNRSVPVAQLREDEAKESAPVEVLLKNAPKQRKGYFNVPKVVD